MGCPVGDKEEEGRKDRSRCLKNGEQSYTRPESLTDSGMMLMTRALPFVLKDRVGDSKNTGPYSNAVKETEY